MDQYRLAISAPKRTALVWVAVECLARIRHLLIPDAVHLAEVIEGYAEACVAPAAVLESFQAFLGAHYTPRVVPDQDGGSLIDIGAYDSHGSEAVASAAYLVIGDLIDPDDDRFHSTRELFCAVEGIAECCRHAVMATTPDIPWRQEDLPPELEPSRATFLALAPAQVRQLQRTPELDPALHAVWQALNEASSRRESQRNAVWEAEELAQCDLVREVLVPPFVTGFSPSLRTSTVTALARGIVKERALDRLPILADALQDAGCEDEYILDHCRGSGLHVRGCWVVGLVLDEK
jgi:hypothetical protein